MHTSAATLPILTFGTDEQRSRFVPPLARGEADRRVRADRDGSRLRRGLAPHRGRGERRRLAHLRDEAVHLHGRIRRHVPALRAHRPDTPGARGVSAFILDAEHIRVTGHEEKLGLNSSVTNSIAIDGAEVGPDRLLHEEGKGFTVAMATLDGGRIGIGAQALGIAQAAFDFARNTRSSGGSSARRSPSSRPSSGSSRTWRPRSTPRGCSSTGPRGASSRGSPHTEEGAKAKLFASETARRQTGEAIQILGGYGYTKEFPVERYYRDAKITEIYEGTSEIQRLVIARSILGLQQRALASG